MREMDLALRGTRGAAVAVARTEPEAGRLLFRGIGKPSAYILGNDKRPNMPSHPGIVGHHTLWGSEIRLRMAAELFGDAERSETGIVERY